MTDKRKYTKDDIQKLEWNEHIRLRPGMYLGRVNIKGFVELLKGLYSNVLNDLESDSISFEITKPDSGVLSITNIQSIVVDNWSKWDHNSHRTNPFILEFQTLNALSVRFKIHLFDKDYNCIYEQQYAKGVFLNGDKDKNEIRCSKMEIDFTLDKKIWGDNFEWNENFISHEISEFAYLHKKVKFKFLYQVGNENCNIIYHFKNGLSDRLEIEKLSGLGGSYFETSIDEQIENFRIEVAFAFRDYTVDEPFLRSFVNDYYTHENGSHVDGLLKGLTYGVMKYFQKHNLTEVFKISEKGMKENLIAAINIRMEAPVFSGCVKNKLSNSEIIEPIANYVSDLLFKKIEENEESTKKLIQKFEIGDNTI
ncbi:hypothetical protein [uncultured Lacinutrix sp.]|uniref:hypothetical protein n=1 Tax=uncultured Lacinutrix sp. TaxID=574032 RepID=UPI00260FA790|nr:hypothetical protein [uncultured Lacinutrix sp.]